MVLENEGRFEERRLRLAVDFGLPGRLRKGE